jgi:hypothetical protein
MATYSNGTNDSGSGSTQGQVPLTNPAKNRIDLLTQYLNAIAPQLFFQKHHAHRSVEIAGNNC